MAFLIFCAMISFEVQLAVLLSTKKSHRKLRYLSTVILVGTPLGSALYCALLKPEIPYLGWEFELAMYLWVAAATTLGNLAAWAAYAIRCK